MQKNKQNTHIMAERVFEVIREISNNIDFDNTIKTQHWSFDRLDRHNKIMRFIGNGTYVKSFEVNTEHPNGHEIHNVFDNGIVLIQNIHTRKVITELIARPNQIRRYWHKLGRDFSPRLNYITDKAYIHEINGWNNW